MKRALLLACAVLAGCFDFDGLRLRTSTDAGSDAATDAAVDSGPPTNCSGAFRCDNFDTLPVDGVYDQHDWSDSSMVVSDQMRVYRGSGSAKAHLEINGGTPRMSFAQLGINASLPSVLYMRAFVYVPALPANELSLLYFANASVFVAIGVRPTGQLAIEHGVTGMDAANVMPTTTTMPIDRWVCIEWKVAHNGTPDTGYLKVDGNVVSATLPAETPGYNSLGFGIGLYTPNPQQYDLWYDEVVVDLVPVDCSR